MLSVCPQGSMQSAVLPLVQKLWVWGSNGATSMCLLGLTFDATSATHLFVRAAADTLIFETVLPYTRTINALMASRFYHLDRCQHLGPWGVRIKTLALLDVELFGSKSVRSVTCIPHTSSKTAACNPNLGLKTKNTFLSTQVQHTNLDPEFFRLRGCKSCKRLRFGRRCNWVSNVFPLRLLNFETWWSLKVEEFQMLGFGLVQSGCRQFPGALHCRPWIIRSSGHQIPSVANFQSAKCGWILQNSNLDQISV